MLNYKKCRVVGLLVWCVSVVSLPYYSEKEGMYRPLSPEETDFYTALPDPADLKRESQALSVVQALVARVPRSRLPQAIRTDYFELYEFEHVCDFSSGVYNGGPYSFFIAPFSIRRLNDGKIKKFTSGDVLSYVRDAHVPEGAVCVAVLSLRDFNSPEMSIQYTLVDEVGEEEVFPFTVYVIDDMSDKDPAKEVALKVFGEYINGVEKDGAIVFAGVGAEKFKLVCGTTRTIAQAIFTDLTAA